MQRLSALPVSANHERGSGGERGEEGEIQRGEGARGARCARHRDYLLTLGIAWYCIALICCGQRGTNSREEQGNLEKLVVIMGRGVGGGKYEGGLWNGEGERWGG